MFILLHWSSLPHTLAQFLFGRWSSGCSRFVVGSSFWSHVSVFPLTRCYKGATWPSKLMQWITAFLPWGISTHCILTVPGLIHQEADRGYLGTVALKLNIHLELTCVLKSSIPPSRLKQTRWGIYLELLFLILSFFSLPRYWQWGKDKSRQIKDSAKFFECLPSRGEISLPSPWFWVGPVTTLTNKIQ